ncbi:MAG: hypothetical protein ACRYHQ_29655 [Janthinobacterium lividum]
MAAKQDVTAKPDAPALASNVISAFRRRPVAEGETEIRIGLAPTSTTGGPVEAAIKSSLDLTGKRKVWFMIGGGNSGKTVEARYLIGQMQEQGREAILAALDPANRSLATWFEEVEQPPTSDGAQTARWLREFLTFLMTERTHTAMLDFGAGDTALAKLVDAAPGIATTMEDAGLAPVACYCLTPRPDDLAALDTLEAAGFQPKATVLMFNEGRADSSMSRDEAFARVLRHSSVRSALARGAMPLWLPRLEPEVMQEIEGKRLQFVQARDGQVPASASFSPIGGFERAMVRRWMERMEAAHTAIATWLP